MKTFRFIYTMALDIPAENVEEATATFEEVDLSNQPKSNFRDLTDVFEVDENGVRKD
jgi:hypothetical protein